MTIKTIVPCLAVAGLVATAALSAHPLSVSYAEYAVQERAVDAAIRLPMDDVDLLLRLDRDLDRTVTDAELTAAQDLLQGYVAKHLWLEIDGVVMPPALSRVLTWRDPAGAPYVELDLAFDVPQAIDAISIHSDFLADLYPDHKTLGEIRVGGRSEQFVFEPRQTYSSRAAGAGPLTTAISFVTLGIEHIFTGYDHILFLFGLLLVGTTLRKLIAIVTSFTIAHSATLVLATLGLVTPIPWMVEAGIALSIAYIGVENLFLRDPAHRWKITFVFGLVHGFGFASVLREMHLPRTGLAVSLFSFNLGVELGQIAIVTLMYPALLWLSRTPYRLRVVQAASCLIVVVGLIWFYQRLP